MVEFKVSGFRFQVSGCGFQVSGRRLQVAGFTFHTHASRFTLYALRFTLYALRFTLHLTLSRALTLSLHARRARSLAPRALAPRSRARHASRRVIVSGGGGNGTGGSLGFSTTGIEAGAGDSGGLARAATDSSEGDAVFVDGVAGDDTVDVTATGAVANTGVGAGDLVVRAGCISRSRSRR